MTPRGRVGGGSAPRQGARTPPADRGDLAARRARLREVVEPVARTAGVEVEQVILSRAGRRHLVRVVVDRAGGVGLDAIAEVSRSVSAALDAAEEKGPALLSGEYLLEVSSPGVDRPLTEPGHWRRNLGRLVTVAVTEGAAARQVTGRITGADATGVVLDVDGTARRLGYEVLGPGRVQVEFHHPDEGEEVEGEGT